MELFALAFFTVLNTEFSFSDFGCQLFFTISELPGLIGKDSRDVPLCPFPGLEFRVFLFLDLFLLKPRKLSLT